MRKILCSFPRQADSWHFDKLYRAGKIELELVPQGTLAERIRAAGAGIGAFFTPTAFGTRLAEGKETRRIDGRDYVLEYPIHADYALIKADRADRWGNLTYRKTARNFGPIMAVGGEDAPWCRCARRWSSASSTPRHVVTPGIFVKRVVRSPQLKKAADEKTRPQPDRRARGARHPRRRLREPRHRPADAGRRPPAEGPRDHPAQRERHPRPRPQARARAKKTKT